MKKVSFIVPRYKETIKDLLPMFSSLRMQVNFDFGDIEILICDDNPDDPLDDSEFEFFGRLIGIDTTVIHLPENKGPGVARQYGIDNATGEWLMFCDADDSLYSANVFSILFKEIEKFPETDYMSSIWIEECKADDTNEILYIQHNLENTWMHGKLIKRSLVQDNNIRFHDELRVHEDSYFLALVADVAKARRLLTTPSYIWRWSENTITRKDKGIYRYEDFPTFIHAITLSNAELKRRESKMLGYHVVQLLIYCYFVLQQDEWIKPEVEKYRKKSIEVLKTGMKDFWDVFDGYDPGALHQIYAEERQKHFIKNEIEHYSLYEWVNMLRK